MVKISSGVICLAIVVFLSGAYLLEDSVRNLGRYAEEWIWIGALLLTVGSALISWLIKLHQFNRGVQRHTRGR
jgi:Kef-type K+ transport system membrane component KefB